MKNRVPEKDYSVRKMTAAFPEHYRLLYRRDLTMDRRNEIASRHVLAYNNGHFVTERKINVFYVFISGGEY